MAKPKDVDAYIALSPIEAHRVMKEIRAIIKSTIPEAEEGISWNVPFYKYHGALGGFASYKNHVSFGVDAITSEDRKILEEKGYKTGKKTVQVKFDQKVPAVILRKILKTQAQLNEAKKQKNK